MKLEIDVGDANGIVRRNFGHFSNGYASRCGNWMQNAKYVSQVVIVHLKEPGSKVYIFGLWRFALQRAGMVVQSKIQNLTSSIEVQKGDVSNYCLGVLCCGIAMTLLATLSPILL